MKEIRLLKVECKLCSKCLGDIVDDWARQLCDACCDAYDHLMFVAEKEPHRVVQFLSKLEHDIVSDLRTCEYE